MRVGGLVWLCVRARARVCACLIVRNLQGGDLRESNHTSIDKLLRMKKRQISCRRRGSATTGAVAAARSKALVQRLMYTCLSALRAYSRGTRVPEHVSA